MKRLCIPVLLLFAGMARGQGALNYTPPAVGAEDVSSFIVFAARCIVASAGGGNFTNSMTVNWFAIRGPL